MNKRKNSGRGWVQDKRSLRGCFHGYREKYNVKMPQEYIWNVEVFGMSQANSKQHTGGNNG
jgi:hypothetical protein